MGFAFNPFTGNFDQKGSGGGGGGSAFFAGEVATYADLPLDGSAALDSRWLVRSNSGTWPFSSYKQSGIYIRTATVGSSRDNDYKLTDTSFHDVMSDDAFLIFDNTDPTKAAKFDVGAQVGANQTRVITVPNKNITLDDAGDSRSPTSHTHGNLTNAGAIGTTANLPLRTGTNGVIEAGSFGTAAGSFCEGNDARLSDARTPSSTLAHKSSHATGGTDALAPSDIGAQSIFVTEALGTITADVTLTAARAKIYTVTANASGLAINLPTTNIQTGDVVQIRFTSFTGQTLAVKRAGAFYGNDLRNGQQATYIAASTAANSWEEAGNNRMGAGTIQTSGGPVVIGKNTSGAGVCTELGIGTAAGEVAAGNHTHVVADVTGAAASGSITTSGLTQATARILGRTSSSAGAVEEIQIGSGLSLSAGELSATGGSGSSIMQSIAVGFVLN